MRRATLIPVLLSALTVGATVTLPTTAASAVQAEGVTVEGTYQHVVADGLPGRAHDERDLLVAGDKSYELRLPKGHTLEPGSKIRVGGQLQPSSDGPQALTADVTVVTSVATDAPPANEQQRVLVILASWTAPDAVTPEQARQQFFTDTDSWYREVSYGQLGLTGDVTPWLQIAGPDDGRCYTNHRQTMTQAKAAALAVGFDAAGYDRTVLYFPASTSPDCANYAGWAYQPGTETWLNGVLDRRTTVHEMGHNLGLAHAKSSTCKDGAGAFVTFSSTCSVSEYGDHFDAMGGSNLTSHFSAPHKQQLGWLSGRTVDLSTASAALLRPYSSRDGVVAGQVTIGATTFWVEQRMATGVDGRLPWGATSGVLVRTMDTSTMKGNALLDQSPDGSMFSAVLPHGASWALPDGRRLVVGQPTAEGTPVMVGNFLLPTAPTGLTVTALDGAAAVSWLPVLGADPAVTQYVVTTTPATTTVTVGAASTSTALAGLANGITYAVNVAAVNSLGAGPSTTSTVLPADATAPGAATALTLIKGKVKGLAWRNPVDEDFAGVVVLSKQGDSPSVSPIDGTVLYRGSGTFAKANTAARGVWTFSVLAHDADGNVAPAAWVTVTSGQVTASGTAG